MFTSGFHLRLRPTVASSPDHASSQSRVGQRAAAHRAQTGRAAAHRKQGQRARSLLKSLSTEDATLLADAEVCANAGRFLREFPQTFSPKTASISRFAVLDQGLERARQLPIAQRSMAPRSPTAPRSLPATMAPSPLASMLSCKGETRHLARVTSFTNSLMPVRASLTPPPT